jgi:hypothetical protein
MPHRLGSNIGVTIRWSTSIKIPKSNKMAILKLCPLKKYKAMNMGTMK